MELAYLQREGVDVWRLRLYVSKLVYAEIHVVESEVLAGSFRFDNQVGSKAVKPRQRDPRRHHLLPSCKSAGDLRESS